MHNRTLVIDTSYLTYKAYFVYKNLRHKGQPVGALYGFASTIMRLIDEVLPSRIVFARDLPAPTWRHKIYKGYKAGRKPPEPEMISQIPLITEWIESITNNVFAVEGYEADDIIYSVCCNSFAEQSYQEQGIKDVISAMTGEFAAPVFPFTEDVLVQGKNSNQEVYIYSSDKDLYQLFMIPNVTFLKTVKNQALHQKYSVTEFEQEYDLQPQQWLDYKALVGDGSDNLPGIKGFGPKTAHRIISVFGGLEGFLKSLGLDSELFFYYTFTQKETGLVEQQLLDKYGPRIKDGFDNLLMTYKLSQLKLVPRIYVQDSLNLENGREVFERFNFSSLIAKLRNQPGVVNQSAKGLF